MKKYYIHLFGVQKWDIDEVILKKMVVENYPEPLKHSNWQIKKAQQNYI